MRTSTDISVTHTEDSHLLRLVRDLVAIPSVNPATLDEDPSHVGELRMVEYLDACFRRLGLTVERLSAEANRPNLVAMLKRGSSSRHLLLEAHTDTVGTRGMTVDPFGGEVWDNRIYGRGACDTKGPMAAYLTAIHRIIEHDLPFDGILSFAACIGEEDGCHGARYLMKSGFRADAAVVAEPTTLRLINAHKGAFWWRLIIRGKAGHGAEPALGVNAIYRVGRVLGMIEDDLLPALDQYHDPILGVPTVNVGTIKGGRKTNIIPDECVIEIDRRTVSGEDPDVILTDFLCRVERLGIPAGDVRVEEVQRAFPFITSREEPVVRAMADALERLGEEVSPTSVNYFSDAGEFAAAGIPSIVFGPGDIRQAHTADEYIELDQLERAVPVLMETVMRFFNR